jgi:hypothetical protein
MRVLARPKMVTNSFGNRNFMQPMGRLSMHSKSLDGGRIFFHFLFVPNMFPSSSQWVPIRLPMCSLGSQCVSLGCSQSHMFCPKSSPSHLYRWAQGVRGTSLSVESSILGALHSFNFFLCDGPIKLAYCKKKKKLDL